MLDKIISESIRKSLSQIIEGDRHREGYYEDYAKRTGKKDRHSPDYYKKYNEKKKQESQNKSSNTPKKKTKSRKAYYRQYNLAHPERLNRGFTKGYENGNVSDGPLGGKFSEEIILGYDELGRPITNHPLADHLRNKEWEWHDDDWCEDCD